MIFQKSVNRGSLLLDALNQVPPMYQINSGDAFSSSIAPAADFYDRILSGGMYVNVPGIPGALTLNSWLNLFYAVILDFLGVNWVYHEAIVYAFFYLVGAIGFYLFAIDAGVFRGYAFVGALLWVLNPFTAIVFPSYIMLPVIAFFPWLIRAIIAYSRAQKIMTVSEIAFFVLMLSPVAANPPLYISVAAAGLVFFCWYSVTQRIKINLKLLLVLVLTLALTNLFWAINVWYYVVDSGIYEKLPEVGAAWEWTSSKSSVLNILSFKGHWSFGENVLRTDLYESKYYPWDNLYADSLLSVVFIVGLYGPIMYWIMHNKSSGTYLSGALIFLYLYHFNQNLYKSLFSTCPAMDLKKAVGLTME